MAVEKVLLAKPRGFCAGVEMAIKALSWMVRIFDPPVYCYHEIVHNKIVVDRFTKVGVIFVEDPCQVPAGSPIMLSAHGSSPQAVEASKALTSISINAVCPLVTKVHHEVKTRSSKGFEIIYIGHHGHDEALGTIAVAPDAVHLIESISELEGLGEITSPVALLAQTTLAVDDWQQIALRAREMYPDLWMPSKSDLCFATTNRQGALKTLAPSADVIIVIGSPNSSNTLALEKAARRASSAPVYRVNSSDELPKDLEGVVVITAGASAPEELISEVISFLNPRLGFEEVLLVEEDEYFPPPRELREFTKALAIVISFAFGQGMPDSYPLDDDPSHGASEIIVNLEHMASASKSNSTN